MPAARTLAIVAAALAVQACKEPPAPAPTASAPPIASAPAAPPPPSPIDAALPATAPPPLDRRAECAKEGCPLSHLVPDEVRPALSDGAPMVVWDQVIGERASVTFPRDEAVELSGVVLDGNLDVTPLDAPTAKSVGGRWTAFRAPGGGVTLTGNGGKPARVALVVALAVPSGGNPGLGAHIDQRDRPDPPAAWTWQVRRKRVDTLAFADLADLAWGAGAYHARIGWEGSTYRNGEAGATGSKTWKVDDHPAAVVDLLRFSRDAGVAEHEHGREWECLAVLEGEGVLMRRTAKGEELVPVRAGTIVTIPAGVRHAWKPSGKAPLLAIQVYAPPGPEQRFKKLAGKAP